MATCAYCQAGGTYLSQGRLECNNPYCKAPSVLVIGDRHFEDANGNPLTMGDAWKEALADRPVYLKDGLLRYDENGNLVILEGEEQ